MRHLAATLDARRQDGGAGVDARLDFDANGGARQRFRIAGLDVATLHADAPRETQDAAALALSASLAQLAQPGIAGAEPARLAQAFAATAASHDYASLLALTSALAGIGRERVQALLRLP